MHNGKKDQQNVIKISNNCKHYDQIYNHNSQTPSSQNVNDELSIIGTKASIDNSKLIYESKCIDNNSKAYYKLDNSFNYQTDTSSNHINYGPPLDLKRVESSTPQFYPNSNKGNFDINLKKASSENWQNKEFDGLQVQNLSELGPIFVSGKSQIMPDSIKLDSIKNPIILSNNSYLVDNYHNSDKQVRLFSKKDEPSEIFPKLDSFPKLEKLPNFKQSESHIKSTFKPEKNLEKENSISPNSQINYCQKKNSPDIISSNRVEGGKMFEDITKNYEKLPGINPSKNASFLEKMFLNPEEGPYNIKKYCSNEEEEGSQKNISKIESQRNTDKTSPSNGIDNKSNLNNEKTTFVSVKSNSKFTSEDDLFEYTKTLNENILTQLGNTLEKHNNCFENFENSQQKVDMVKSHMFDKKTFEVLETFERTQFHNQNNNNQQNITNFKKIEKSDALQHQEQMLGVTQFGGCDTQINELKIDINEINSRLQILDTNDIKNTKETLNNRNFFIFILL